MEIWALVLAGFAFLALKKGQGGPVVPTDVKPAPPPTPAAPPKELTKLVTGVSGVAQSLQQGNVYGAIAQGAMVVAESSGDAYGALLGNTTLGKSLGYVQFAFSEPIVPVVIGGVVTGKEVNKALGGEGSVARSVVAEVWGGLTAGIWYALGAFAGAYIAVIGSIVYAVTAVFDDHAKLMAYRDGAPIRDFYDAWAASERKLLTSLQTAQATTPGLKIESDLVNRRFVIPATDGMMRMTNRLNYEAAKARPWGIASNFLAHLQWQYERGAFIGDYDRRTGELINRVPQLSRTEWFVNNFTRQEDRYIAEERGYFTPLTWGKSWKPGENIHLSNESGFWAPTVKTNYYPADTVSDLISEAAEAYCNFCAYVAWMREVWGLFQSEGSHAAHGLKNGKFLGRLVNAPFYFWSKKGGRDALCQGHDALLVYGDKVCYWRDVNGEPGVYVKVRDVTDDDMRAYQQGQRVLPEVV